LPLRFGAGVKGKLLESLYHQIPAVITSVAAEGVPEIEHYSMIADDAVEFAKKIHQLYTDKESWQYYSTKGRELINKYYTEEAARKIMEEVFSEK
jgi:glycosyltransferase involved in cell wall biosynthesis